MATLRCLPQHRHERDQAVRPRDGDHLLAVPAPVDVGLHAVGLPADVPEMLDAEAPEAHRYLAAAARPRARIRRQRTALLVGPDRRGSSRVPLLRPAMAMPEGLGRHAAPATADLVEMSQVIEASLGGDLGKRQRRTEHEALGPLELDLLAVGLQRHANHLVERARELSASQGGHGRKIVERNVLPDVFVEDRADPPYGASVPGHGERIAQEEQLPLPLQPPSLIDSRRLDHFEEGDG
jgi:hypothetical protein